MNALDRMAARWLRGRGYIPEPGVMVGAFGGVPADAGEPADYLAYGRTSNPVYACVQLRARMLSGLPILAYRETSTGGRGIDLSQPHARLAMPSHTRAGRSTRGMRAADVVEGGPVVDLLASVNDGWTWRQLIYTTEQSLCLTGQAFWLIDRGPTGDGPPTAIYYVRHSRMTMHRGPEGVTGWTVDKGRESERRVSAGEVMWLRYPDPSDPDFGVLPPMAAARLGADSYTAAMRANKGIFDNGIMTAGILVPPEGGDFWTADQLSDIATSIDRRFKGADKAHRIGVLRERFDIIQPNLSPRDAEFQALLDFSIEDVARAFGVPIEFVGGTRRTYENLPAAMTAVWMQTLGPEAAWLAEEITERLLPMFPPGAAPDWVAFDLGGVSALQEDETARWAREREQIAAGVLQGNEWRTEQGMDPLETAGASIEVGKVGAILQALTAMGQGLVTPESVKAMIVGAIGLPESVASAIVGSGPPPMPAPEPEPAPAEEPATLAAVIPAGRAGPEWDGPEHRAIIGRAADRTRDDEAAFERAVTELFQRQAESILAKLAALDDAAGDDGRGVRRSPIGPADLADLFDMARWIREFRQRARERLTGAARAGASVARDDLEIAEELPRDYPPLVRFVVARSQRFARHVNETTWGHLKDTLLEGMANGEPIRPGPDTLPGESLSERVTDVMRGRIASSAETIARTEVVSAYTGGGLVYVRELSAETGRRYVKTWVTALDERVRDSHRAMHGASVDLDADFLLAGGSGPAPGQIDAAEESINCRCVVTYNRAGRAGAPSGRRHHRRVQA